jgi:cobalt-zinc-cadmium efflux system membrane fusion protein
MTTRSMKAQDSADSVVLRVALVLVLVAFGCTKGAGRDRSSAISDSAMAAMPGMDMHDAKGEVVFTAAQIKHGGIRWEPVAVGSAAASASVPGQLVANEDRTARLGAPASGRVVAVRVRPGDAVATGSLLVTLASPDAAMAQSDVTKASAEVSSRLAQATYARAARERAERLLALKAIPQQDVEKAIADDELAKAALAQAQAELRRARSTAAQLGAGEVTAAGEVALRSPLSGVVLARTAVPGSVVEAGAPLVVVTDPTSLWLQIDAPEQLASLFRRGGRLRFMVPSAPADTFDARVDAVGAGLDPETRTLSVRAMVPNARARLKASMVEGAATTTAALVPEDAVQMVDSQPSVFIARPDGKGGARFTQRVVTVGSRGGGKIAVMSGLAAGDVIVTHGAFAVRAQLEKGSMPDMEM